MNNQRSTGKSLAYCPPLWQGGLIYEAHKGSLSRSSITMPTCHLHVLWRTRISGGLLWDLPEDDFPNGSPIVTAFSNALGL